LGGWLRRRARILGWSRRGGAWRWLRFGWRGSPWNGRWLCGLGGAGWSGRLRDLGEVGVETLREAAHARVGLIEQRIHFVKGRAGAQRQRKL
jgi:hypothetical protein